jgi:transcriptional regulator with XRE-family HTH domain
MERVGDRIKQLRESKSLSLKDLSEASKTTQAAISRYENNLRMPRFDILSRISDALDVSIEYLVSGSSNEKEKGVQVTEDANQYNEFMKKANAFFMNNDVSEEDKETFFRDITELFWQSKAMNREKESKNKAKTKKKKV